MEIATPCGLCSERDAIPLRQYVEEGRTAAAAIAYTKYTKKKVAQAPGPAWITSYLENQLENGLDTPICSACIAKHELKYSRVVGSAGASEQLLCACGFWSCTNQKGLEVVDLGDERLLLQQKCGVYACGDRVRMCSQHKRDQKREKQKLDSGSSAKKIAGQSDALGGGGFASLMCYSFVLPV